MKIVLVILGILFLNNLLICQALRHFTFKVKEASYSRLCSTKKILTVNGGFPGPILYATKGETVIVNVYNLANESITIHWHGVNQPRYPWSDGPEFITQCPIKPDHKFSQKVIFSEEEGTLWWHAHNHYNRATVHGAIIIRPRPGTTYPFPKPHKEFPIILGVWWKKDIVQVFNDFRKNGGDPVMSDAFTINGQPGDFYSCSKNETTKIQVHHGKTYLLRIINAVQENIMIFGIANHNLTVVASDGSYIKPINVSFIIISPGQTMDVLLEANQKPLGECYMASKVYTTDDPKIVPYNPTITTSILQYKGHNATSSSPSFPSLPGVNDTNAFRNFVSQFRSLADKNHPTHMPLNISTSLFYTVSINILPCNNEDGSKCSTGPNGDRLSASVNNISYHLPNTTNILEAYYYENVKGVFGREFPDVPPLWFNFTGEPPMTSPFVTPSVKTEVRVLEYGSNVELVIQGTNLLFGTDHPIHLHGHSFYVVGWGYGNFDKDKDPLKYNLVDPPYQNTINVPKNGWVTIRFTAKNPGVWFMHCHFERHGIWGMAMTFLVKDGKNAEEKMLPPPPDMPKC